MFTKAQKAKFTDVNELYCCKRNEETVITDRL
jgi:hypothetical protein